MSRHKYGNQIWIAYSRCGRTRDLYIVEDPFFVLVPEIAGNKPYYSVGRFAAFICLFLPIEVFVDDDS